MDGSHEFDSFTLDEADGKHGMETVYCDRISGHPKRPIDKIQHSNKPSACLIQHISAETSDKRKEGRKGGRRSDERDSQLLLPRYMTDILRGGSGHQRRKRRMDSFPSLLYPACPLPTHPSILQEAAHSALMSDPTSPTILRQRPANICGPSNPSKNTE